MNRFRRFSLATLFGGVAALATSRAFAHGGWRGNHGPLDPAAMDAHIDRMIRHLAIEVDATPEQQQKLGAIARQAAREFAPLREEAREARKQAIALLTAPQVDRAALERLRAGHVQHAEQASRRIVQTVADAADVLTAEQRKQLAQHLERRGHRWHRG
jgi:periplasmic protein CpxP/Spy